MARATRHLRSAHFERVIRLGLGIAGVTARTKYDGSPVLQFGGCFLAGLATHPSAEADTLVVRYELTDREWLLDDAPDVYYVTDYYRKYPLVLVRLPHIDDEALRELLNVSRQLTAAKTRRRESRGARGLRLARKP